MGLVVVVVVVGEGCDWDWEDGSVRERWIWRSEEPEMM